MPRGHRKCWKSVGHGLPLGEVRPVQQLVSVHTPALWGAWLGAGREPRDPRWVHAGRGQVVPRLSVREGVGHGLCPGRGASLRSLDVGMQDRACARPIGWDHLLASLRSWLPPRPLGVSFLGFITPSFSTAKSPGERQKNCGPSAQRGALQQDRGTSHHARGRDRRHTLRGSIHTFYKTDFVF